MKTNIIVNFKQWVCLLHIGTYANNGSKALELKDQKTDEPIATCTVNIPEIQLDDDFVLIKDYSENEGMVKSLIESKIIEPKSYNSISSGFVNISAYKLTDRVLYLIENYLSETV